MGSLIPNKKEETAIPVDNSLSTVLPLDAGAVSSGERVEKISPDLIKANPWQPRNNFDRERMDELMESIKKHGIIQPLVVTKEGRNYQLIAGERRLRAAKMLGLSEVPVIVREASDKDKLELSIIENVQRHNLNPLEEAESYKRLLEEFGLSREDISKQVGKSLSAISNYLRLLKLPLIVQQALSEEKISFSHAKVILSYPDKMQQIKAYKKILKEDLSVHAIYDEAKQVAEKAREDKPKDPILTSWEDRLSRNLGAKVRIDKRGEKGSIKIDFYSHEELKNLLDKFEK